MKMGFVVGLLAGAAVLAGCSGTTTQSHDDLSTCPPSQCPTAAPGSMVITGLVESNALVPLAGANVTIPELGLRQATDASGRFAFPGLATSVYTVAAEHAGFAVQTKTARPEVTSLQFILGRAAPTQPYNVTLPPLHGVFECASETVILSGACDIVLQDYGHTAVFHNQSAFLFQTDLAWKTIVIDLVFDSANNPGVDGMRETLRGQNSTATLGTYDQYGRFFGPTSFSQRIEPGMTYQDGDRPVPANVTAFRLDLYPQGHEYHEVCHPDLPTRPAECFLGAGAAVNLRFDVYISIFYVDPAPVGFTLIGA